MSSDLSLSAPARVVIVGGTGFIGRHLAAALGRAEHEVLALGRGGLDLGRDGVPSMVARLAGFQVVINAAGLVRGQGANTLAAVHAEGAQRLFQACVEAGVSRLFHISALGASSDGETPYQRTKGRGEEALATPDGPPDGTPGRLDWCVLRPSLVIGRGGASTELLSALAALPWPPRLGPGTWQVQPVHVDDLADLVVSLISRPGPLPRTLDVVGPEPLGTDALLAGLRRWLGLPQRRFLPVPEAALTVLAAVGERLIGGAVGRGVLAMLKKGNTGPAGPVTVALGRPPRPLALALARHPVSKADLLQARLFFIRPLLRLSLGLLWVVTGLLSLGLYPLAGSLQLLASVGLDGVPAELVLTGAALLDLVLGCLLLAGFRPVAVGAAMLATMGGFSLIALGLPAEYWLHPFAPLLKNLPIAVATLAMMALEA